MNARKIAKESYCATLQCFSVFNSRLRINPALEWLLILTMPNSGSTALGRLLMTSKSAVALTDRCEGEWLIPSASKTSLRWDDSYMPSMARIRARWLDRLSGSTVDGPKIVIEKSPANMVRVDALRKILSPMKTHTVVLVRDPYATCESWHRRHGKPNLERSSMPDLRLAENEQDYFTGLGRYWAKRWSYLSPQRDASITTIRYEDLVSQPATTLAPIAARIPALSDIQVDAQLQVKDYQAQPLKNMNDRQISSLSSVQISAITRGLESYEDELAALDYALR